MKAEIIVNRHIAAKNKKTGTDEPCISVQTSRGKIYGRSIEFTGTAKLIQDTDHPRACGATIWLECAVEDLIIDGVPGAAVVAALPPKKKPKATAQAAQLSIV